MNSILFFLRLVSMVVKFLVCFSMGFEVDLRFLFILCVIILVSVVLFSFGGLKIKV